MLDEATVPVPDSGCAKTTVLMVEDHVIVRAFCSEALREFGHEVIEAASADEAVALLRSQLKVDVVITDLEMPGSIDGGGLAQLIRAEYQFLRVIMLSGHFPDALTLSRVDRFFRKPANPADLDDCLRTWFPAPTDVPAQ